MKKIFAVLIISVLLFVPVTVFASERIPSGGGTVQVNGTTSYSFTPSSSGFWVFETSNNTNSDPLLSLYNSEGRLIARDDDGAGNLNSLIMIRLEQGREYRVEAGFFSGNTGRYMLTVSRLNVSEISSVSEVIRVNEEIYFSFSPTSTGLWSFHTSNNGKSDPYLWLYDITGRMINFDDDSGDGLNAHLTAILVEGAHYLLRAGYYGRSGGTYNLHITQTPVQNISGAGSFAVENGAFFSFVPREAGFWIFSTSDNRRSDPQLWLYDERGILASDDDSGEGLNASLLVPLEAGRQYFLHAGFYAGAGGSYTLTVARAEMPAPLLQNPRNLFEANQHRADRPPWMEDRRFQNHERTFGGTNGEWESTVRALFHHKDIFRVSIPYFSLISRPLTHDFSMESRRRLTQAVSADSYFNQFPFNRVYVSEAIFSYLGFYFATGEFGGGMYIGRDEFSTILLDVNRRNMDWAVAVLGHEFAHALAFGESLSDFIEESLMGWEFSTQGEGADIANPLGIRNNHGLMYNSTFDRTLERLAGPEDFWFFASFSDHAYGELWDEHLSHAISFREMQVLRSVMIYTDSNSLLAFQLEEFTNIPAADLSEEILRNWRTIFNEAHPSNNFDTRPPTPAQQQQALQNLNNQIEAVMEFARRFNIPPANAVLSDIQGNHRRRLQNAA
jgi:hypothetical protein